MESPSGSPYVSKGGCWAFPQFRRARYAMAAPTALRALPSRAACACPGRAGDLAGGVADDGVLRAHGQSPFVMRPARRLRDVTALGVVSPTAAILNRSRAASMSVRLNITVRPTL